MKTDTVRITLFFSKSRDLVKIGRFERSPSGGGWRLDNKLAFISLSEFSSNPEEAIERFVTDHAEQRLEEVVVNKAFLAKHDEVTVILSPGGAMQLIPIRRDRNGLGGSQSSDALVVQTHKGETQVLMEALKRALASIEKPSS